MTTLQFMELSYSMLALIGLGFITQMIIIFYKLK